MLCCGPGRTAERSAVHQVELLDDLTLAQLLEVLNALLEIRSKCWMLCCR